MRPTQKDIERAVARLFHSYTGEPPEHFELLPPSGSNRQYHRLKSQGHRLIAAYNPDQRENRAFAYLTRHFDELGLPVPKLLAENIREHVYLLTDLGDTTLFSILPSHRTTEALDEEVMEHYRQALDWLVQFQVAGTQGLDFSQCYPRHAFDRQSMMWDLNYFKYYYLKFFGLSFDEQKLEEAFEAFVHQLLGEQSKYFMYRDFQSRNIMIREGQSWFIDYQGGRKGPLAYDVASLLFDSKADIPFHQRQELLGHYVSRAASIPGFDSGRFLQGFYDWVVIRLMQAMGAYGYRGGFEKKSLFLQSIPYALNNLRWLAENNKLPESSPYLAGILERMAADAPALPTEDKGSGLLVRVNSFSYHNQRPSDPSGHGGGFVFDCRCLPNPGREESLRLLNGTQPALQGRMQQWPEVNQFMEFTKSLVDMAVTHHQSRGFESLSVSYGCTGGQHRSVYCAEELARYVSKKHAVRVQLRHWQKGSWPGTKT